MIKLEILVSEVEYEAILDRYWPYISEKLKESGHPIAKMAGSALPPAMVKSLVSAMPQEKKDRLIAELINVHEKKVCEKIESLAQNAEVGIDVQAIHAEVK